MKLKEAAKKVEDGIEETLTYCDFPVPSRFMRKIVCRLRLNKVSRQ